MVGRAAVLAMLSMASVGAVACTSALAQTEEEADVFRAAREAALRISDLYLPDGGSQPCHQLNIIGNDCHAPSGGPVGCCLYNLDSPPSQLYGPACVSYAPLFVSLQQVGKGYCCELWYPGSGIEGWVRFEDETQPCEFCGGKTPTENECCTRDRDIIPAYPVTDKSKCPALQQDPDHPPSVTTPPCGSEELIKKGYKIPQSPTGAPFFIGCAAHDICYSTCNSDRAACDTAVKVQLATICDEYFGPLLASSNEVDADQVQIAWGYCRGFANIYYAAVSSRGASAYEAAQAKVCRCCKGGPDAPPP